MWVARAAGCDWLDAAAASGGCAGGGSVGKRWWCRLFDSPVCCGGGASVIWQHLLVPPPPLPLQDPPPTLTPRLLPLSDCGLIGDNWSSTLWQFWMFWVKVLDLCRQILVPSCRKSLFCHVLLAAAVSAVFTSCFAAAWRVGRSGRPLRVKVSDRIVQVYVKTSCRRSGSDLTGWKHVWSEWSDWDHMTSCSTRPVHWSAAEWEEAEVLKLCWCVTEHVNVAAALPVLSS